MANVPLWEQLLSELGERGKEIIWVEVPSHVTVEGNNEADRLADLGRLASPLTPVSHTPTKIVGPDTPCAAPPPAKKSTFVHGLFPPLY